MGCGGSKNVLVPGNQGVVPSPSYPSEGKKEIGIEKKLEDGPQIPVDQPAIQEGLSTRRKVQPKVNKLKLPDIKNRRGKIVLEPIVIEVDMSSNREKLKRKSDVQTRLEEESKKLKTKKSPTAAALQRRLRAAEERREEHQEEKLRKVQENIASVQRKKYKIQQLEEKKAEQLRKYMEEKKHMAQLNKLEREKHAKRKLEGDAKKFQVVQMKARKLKEGEEEGD
jgi:hypothetical protein